MAWQSLVWLTRSKPSNLTRSNKVLPIYGFHDTPTNKNSIRNYILAGHAITNIVAVTLFQDFEIFEYFDVSL